MSVASPFETHGLGSGQEWQESIRQGLVRMETDDDRLAVTFSYILIWTREWLVDDEFRYGAEDRWTYRDAMDALARSVGMPRERLRQTMLGQRWITEEEYLRATQSCLVGDREAPWVCWRLSVDNRPLTDCVEGADCGCGATITLGPDDELGTRQRTIYGTRAWAESYGRRNAVESADALIKVHYAQLCRGSIRALGQLTHGLLVSIILSTVNIALLGTIYGIDAGKPLPDDAPITAENHAPRRCTASQEPSNARRGHPRRSR